MVTRTITSTMNNLKWKKKPLQNSENTINHVMPSNLFKQGKNKNEAFISPLSVNTKTRGTRDSCKMPMWSSPNTQALILLLAEVQGRALLYAHGFCLQHSYVCTQSADTVIKCVIYSRRMGLPSHNVIYKCNWCFFPQLCWTHKAQLLNEHKSLTNCMKHSPLYIALGLLLLLSSYLPQHTLLLHAHHSDRKHHIWFIRVEEAYTSILLYSWQQAVKMGT